MFTRFHEAQDSDWAGYATALHEMRDGHKRNHWIWYIFPQIDGLGRSSTAREYALRDVDEACDYLRDPILRSRYAEIAQVVAEQLAGGTALETLMGGSTDALKLVSSATLFQVAAARLAHEDPSVGPLALLCETILQHTETQGYPPCSFTRERIAAVG